MLAEVDRRTPKNLACIIDIQSDTTSLVEEGQPMQPTMFSLAMLANARDLVLAHQRLDAVHRHIQEISQRRGVDAKTVFVSL